MITATVGSQCSPVTFGPCGLPATACWSAKEAIHRELATLAVAKRGFGEGEGDSREQSEYAALELMLELQHEMATATPVTVPRAWQAKAAATHRHAWAAAAADREAATVPELWAVWPSLLGGGMAEEIAAAPASTRLCGRAVLWAALAADWAKQTEIRAAIVVVAGSDGPELAGRLLPPLLDAAEAAGLPAAAAAAALGCQGRAGGSGPVAAAVRRWPRLSAMVAVDRLWEGSGGQAVGGTEMEEERWARLRTAWAGLDVRDQLVLARYCIEKAVGTGWRRPQRRRELK